VDIVPKYIEYIEDWENNKILCYTNAAVDRFNSSVHSKHTGKDGLELSAGDMLFLDAHKIYQQYKPSDEFGMRAADDIAIKSNGKEVLTRQNDKYKTIDYLLDNFDFMDINIQGTSYRKAYVFGNTNYMDMDKALMTAAVNSNLAIAKEFNVNIEEKGAIKQVKINNYGHELVVASRQAWRLYLTFQKYVTMVSRPYASTVHKAQGVTLSNVFISNTDLLRLYDRDVQEYISLFYTAMSRARNEVYIDN
jgi:phage gpG-like protein